MDAPDLSYINTAAEGKKIAFLFDISLIKTVGAGQPEYITDLTKPVRFTVDIPQEYQGYKTYGLIQVHYPSEGSEPIVATLQNLSTDGKKLVFEISGLSTFGVPVTGTQKNAPGTGDANASIRLYVGISLLFMAAAAALCLVNKKKQCGK